MSSSKLLEAASQSMTQKIADEDDSSSRVNEPDIALVNGENHSMKKKKLFDHNESNDCKRPRVDINGMLIRVGTKDIPKKCTSCGPQRYCRKCEERVSMMPSIIPLVLDASFIGTEDLGHLSCVNQMFSKFISVDSDEEIWSSLAKQKWPSLFTMPHEIRSEIPYRQWLKNKSKGHLPGVTRDDYLGVKEAREMRKDLRDHLLSMGSKTGELPPLTPPSLVPDDLMFLIDIYDGQQSIISKAIRGSDECMKVFFCENLCPDDPELLTARICLDRKFGPTLGLKLAHSGSFTLGIHQLYCEVYLVRLTDYKTMCMTHGYSYTHFRYSVVEWTQQDQTSNVSFDFKSPDYFSIPTMLTCRMSDGDDAFRGIDVQLTPIVSTPRSPFDLGSEYTSYRLNEYRRIHSNVDNFDDSVLSDGEFIDDLWEDACSKPEFAKFFNQAKEDGSVNGKNYYGTIHHLLLKIRFWFDSDDGFGEFVHPGNKIFSGVSILHILEDMLNMTGNR